MHVSAILRTKGSTIITIKPSETVATAAHVLHLNKIGAILAVDEEGAIAGVLSERDIVRGLAVHGANVLDRPVSSLMTARVVTCRPDDTVASVMVRMTEGRFRHMPVIDNGRLTGVISIGDVVKQRIAEYSHEVESLRDYVAGRA
ncbi:CBS domain-containing protein [Niveispirillum irakense]|uniref:CBS domain-containing protein n=1 Tax=Niveispirillum irakense TaxID=34011 RepID=UPI000422A687|nr:CBS domain-containing protein [Niveispirillum irakense]